MLQIDVNGKLGTLFPRLLLQGSLDLGMGVPSRAHPDVA